VRREVEYAVYISLRNSSLEIALELVLGRCVDLSIALFKACNHLRIEAFMQHTKQYVFAELAELGTLKNDVEILEYVSSFLSALERWLNFHIKCLASRF
jgi:hypothetical protein